jgi:hypothetical protein
MHPAGGAAGDAGAVAVSAPTTRLTGTRLLLVRAIWLALVIISLSAFAVSLPVYHRLVQRPCADPVSCNLAGALTAEGIRQLSAVGLTPASYASVLTIFFAVIVATWSGIGFLIFWRRSDEWFTLFCSLFLIMFNSTYPGFPISALAVAFPMLLVPVTILSTLGVDSIIVFVFLFPNGRLVPRWMGIVLAFGLLGAAGNAISIAFPALAFPPASAPGWLGAAVNILLYASIVFSQVYRYRRVSTHGERQQTKWVVLGIVIVMVGIGVLPVIATYLLPTFATQPNSPLSVLIGLVIYPLVLLALPVTVGLAILRSRLFDIDVLINRTLVYGSLTVLLGLLYAGLIISLETLARLIGGVGADSQLIIVGSTLAIVVLVNPLRRRLQRGIDQRFYRHKYDAAKTLATFGATLRSEVDLGQLSEHLLAVVQGTMQPASVSLWLRPREGSSATRSVDAAPLMLPDSPTGSPPAI